MTMLVVRAPFTYPDGTSAVLPPEVNHNDCDHQADPPVVRCVHDWRIHWGNMNRRPTGQATFVTDSP